eukprot:scaffold52728_cov69-Phaeocystis_antarctica.AAC.5
MPGANASLSMRRRPSSVESLSATKRWCRLLREPSILGSTLSSTPPWLATSTLRCAVPSPKSTEHVHGSSTGSQPCGPAWWCRRE